MNRSPGTRGREAEPRLLALHAVRVMGMSDAHAASARYRLEQTEVAELLLDFEALGWVTRVPAMLPPTWSLTDAGRAENVRQLASELDAVGARADVVGLYRRFVELNARFLTACTDWQIHPTRWDPLARNEHDDWRWDERVLDELGRLSAQLRPITAHLAEVLVRFDGYQDRFTRALLRVENGDRAWVDEPGIDSCHRVWFELHEDLIATLGIDRGDEPA